MEDGTYLIVSLVVRLVFGAVCAAVAISKGRSPVGWFFGGLFIAIIALIIVACLSNLREQMELARIQDNTNRRLREQLRQEQMRVEALRAHTVARLDAHDATLGVNTRSIAPAIGSLPPPTRTGPGQPAGVTPPGDGTAWFFFDAACGKEGPMSIAGLRTEIMKGRVSRDTPVWHEGLADWTPAAQIPILLPLLSTL